MSELTPTEKARLARRAYMKKYMPEYMQKWRKNNPEKAKAIRERYWEKKFDGMDKETSQ